MKFSIIKERIARAILRKHKPKALALVSTTKPKGLKVKGIKLVPKPEKQNKPKAALIKPLVKRIPKMKAVSISKEDRNRISQLTITSPLEAFTLATKKDREIKAENARIMAYNALTEKEKAKAEERTDNLKTVAESIASNLPKISDTALDINANYKVLINILGKIAFCSSLENNILWLADVNLNPSVKIGAQTIKIGLDDRYIFEAAATKLYNCYGMKKSLTNDEGKEASSWDMLRAIGVSARDYQVQQAKLKPLEFYTESLVTKAIEKELKFTGEGSGRKEVLNAITLATAEIAISLGFHTDKTKSAFFCNSSANRFGMSEVSKKDMLPLMVRIIQGSAYQGKLTGRNTPSNLLTGVLNYLPL